MSAIARIAYHLDSDPASYPDANHIIDSYFEYRKMDTNVSACTNDCLRDFKQEMAAAEDELEASANEQLELRLAARRRHGIVDDAQPPMENHPAIDGEIL